MWTNPPKVHAMLHLSTTMHLFAWAAHNDVGDHYQIPMVYTHVALVHKTLLAFMLEAKKVFMLTLKDVSHTPHLLHKRLQISHHTKVLKWCPPPPHAIATTLWYMCNRFINILILQSFGRGLLHHNEQNTIPCTCKWGMPTQFILIPFWKTSSQPQQTIPCPGHQRVSYSDGPHKNTPTELLQCQDAVRQLSSITWANGMDWVEPRMGTPWFA